MVDTEVHRCPRCELRFARLVELEDHLEHDHHLGLRRPDSTGTAAEPTEPSPRTSGTVTVPVDPSKGPGSAVAVAAHMARQAGMALELVAAPSSGLSRSTTDGYLHARVREAKAAGAPAVSWRVLADGRERDRRPRRLCGLDADLHGDPLPRPGGRARPRQRE